jgi:hypothetical protein
MLAGEGLPRDSRCSPSSREGRTCSPATVSPALAEEQLLRMRLASRARRRTSLPPRRGASRCILGGGALLWCLDDAACFSVPTHGAASRGERVEIVWSDGDKDKVKRVHVGLSVRYEKK